MNSKLLKRKAWKPYRRKHNLFAHLRRPEKMIRGHTELNHGPLDLQSNALPLSYTPNDMLSRSKILWIRVWSYKTYKLTGVASSVLLMYCKCLHVYKEIKLFFIETLQIILYHQRIRSISWKVLIIMYPIV